MGSTVVIQVQGGVVVAVSSDDAEADVALVEWDEEQYGGDREVASRVLVSPPEALDSHMRQALQPLLAGWLDV